MPQPHPFLLGEGAWVGEGTVGFSSSTEQMFFVTSWSVEPTSEGKIHCQQEVKMEGVEDTIQNHFQLSDLTPNSFQISLENEIVGKVFGTGIIDETTIAWEFRGHIGFQGYEVYERQADGAYKFHAEYASPDQFRTIIDGRISKQD